MSHHRNPQTAQERRETPPRGVVDEDYGVRVRPKRTRNRLANSLDDIAKARQKCWKKHRKTKWRLK